ncbi:MAG: heme-binding domain-containing protein, partial [Bacteroidales bacterium]|nr:heme-binding domain-containing protein [Bacteroidales bacterium]
QKGENIPEDVKKILSNSCYACHSTGAKAENAVKALNFRKWNDYKTTKKIGLLNNISEVVEEGAMPPEKFLKKYPEKALSGEDKEIILEWTKKETAKIME